MFSVRVLLCTRDVRWMANDIFVLGSHFQMSIKRRESFAKWRIEHIVTRTRALRRSTRVRIGGICRALKPLPSYTKAHTAAEYVGDPLTMSEKLHVNGFPLASELESCRGVFTLLILYAISGRIYTHTDVERGGVRGSIP